MTLKHAHPKLFGTDGIRGLANAGALHIQRVAVLGEATADLLGRRLKRPARVGLGWDTRISSPMLAAALTAGLASGGAETYSFGELPTPAVSFLTRRYRLDGGIVISASHNPAPDNGIKYFSAAGGKFPDAQERSLERVLSGIWRGASGSGVRLGAVRELSAEAAGTYTAFWSRHYARAGLAKLRLVVDLANGAACRTAPPVLQTLGVRLTSLCDQPDGLNINAGCGSLHPGRLARKVRSLGAEAGLAFDGDGDRVIMVDEQGGIVNGDRMLGILARHYAGRGRLPKRRVVATVMSNLGLELYLRQHGIQLLRAAVGDRFVAQVMRRQGLALGGEQSGHILLPHLLPTGDGLVTALEVLAVLRASGRRLSELAGGWRDFPQLLVNVPVARRPDLLSLDAVRREVSAAKRSLKDRGRVNLRYSGTEPLARVMVEAETRALAETWAQRIADAVAEAIGDGQRRTTTWLTCA
jgi:phosphoglucosamine mutase